MPKAPFSPEAVPSFEESPSVILVTGDLSFFVEESAARAVDRLGGDAELVRFDDDAPADAIADALLNRSLFSPRRIVAADVGRLLGTESPGALLTATLESWAKGSPAGRREAFRNARSLLASLDLTVGPDPAETAEGIARKARRKEDAAALAEVLREMPEEKAGPAILQTAIRLLLARGNDGTVALLTATAAPAGVGLVAEIAKSGLMLEVRVGKGAPDALLRLARARAKEREVTVDSDALQRLLHLTDEVPAMFAAELDKLLDIAGPGGRVTASDVRQNVEDAASEDVYPFYDALGRRDAADTLGRLARLFSDRPVRAGDREIDTDDYWPTRFLGMVATEVRRMLAIRSVLGDRFDAGMSYSTFEARVLPRLAHPVPPFDRSPFTNAQGQVSGFAWYKAAQRASRYTVPELARSLARAAELDVALKSSTPPVEALTSWIATLVAGDR